MQSSGPWLKKQHTRALVRPPELTVHGGEVELVSSPRVSTHKSLSLSDSLSCAVPCERHGIPENAASSALQLAGDQRLSPQLLPIHG